MLISCDSQDDRALAETARSLASDAQHVGCTEAADLAGQLLAHIDRSDRLAVEAALDDLALLTEALACGSKMVTPPGRRSAPQVASASSVSSPAAKHGAKKHSPLVSSLPMDDAEFRPIIEGFVGRLGEQAHAMQAAWQRCDLSELGQLAHWLKGAAGTVGFGSFTEPARRLEQFAKDGRVDEIGPALEEVLELADRVVLPSYEPAPMACSLTVLA
jgi:HPt (histidine-containing phosphotransfer) domain-containing protein